MNIEEIAAFFGTPPDEWAEDFQRGRYVHWSRIEITQETVLDGENEQWFPLLREALTQYLASLSPEEKQHRQEVFRKYTKAVQWYGDFHAWLHEHLDIRAEQHADYLLTQPGELFSPDTLGPKAKQFAHALREAQQAVEAFETKRYGQAYPLMICQVGWDADRQCTVPVRCFVKDEIFKPWADVLRGFKL